MNEIVERPIPQGLLARFGNAMNTLVRGQRILMGTLVRAEAERWVPLYVVEGYPCTRGKIAETPMPQGKPAVFATPYDIEIDSEKTLSEKTG